MPARVPAVLVVQHEAACPIDRLGGWLAEAGTQVVLCRPYEGDPVPQRVAQDGLVVLGGHMGALDDEPAPWLPAVRDLLAVSVGDGTPTLGICLGAQLLAVACGGRVEVGDPGIEAGVVDVHWRPAASRDPLVAGLPAPLPGPSMHLDAVVELPAGAAWLGETGLYPHQAFRVGAAAWGVQFHPEVSLATFRTWAAHHDGDWSAWGLDGGQVVGQLERRFEEVTRAGRALGHRFADVIRVTAEAGPPAGVADVQEPISPAGPP